MKILSFVNQKGGTGKSVLALNLAVAAEQAGEKVCVLDLDTQGTVANWYGTRTAETPPVLNHEQVGELGPALERLAGRRFLDRRDRHQGRGQPRHPHRHAACRSLSDPDSSRRSRSPCHELWAWCRKRLGKGTEHEQTERGAGGDADHDAAA